MKYVKEDFDGMGFIETPEWLSNLIGGSIGDVLLDLGHKEAMKLVEKEANVVKSFANKAISAANAVTDQVAVINAATTQEQADKAQQEARNKTSLARTEAGNAAKNFAATQAAMRTLLGIKGLPKAISDTANAILNGAKDSLDRANQAAQRASEALRAVESAHSARYGTFFSNLTSAPFFSDLRTSPYGTYIIVGGSIVAVSLLGLIAYRLVKKKDTKA